MTTDTTSEGCKRGWENAEPEDQENTHNARWILPSGAKVQALVGDGWAFDNDTGMRWTITAKAYADNMNMYGTNPDTIFILCNPTDVIGVINGTTIKPGTCSPWTTNTSLSSAFNRALGYT